MIVNKKEKALFGTALLYGKFEVLFCKKSRNLAE